jgi:Spy/CpxP family protein refolding chaperone
MKTILPIWLLFVLPFPEAIAEAPYAGQEQRHIKSLSATEIASLKNGDGMGFAKLAELNHYPGPKHVLELASELGLTDSQMAQTESLFTDMRNSARSLGRDLLDAEAALDRAFEENTLDADGLESALLAIGELRARLRYVHLEAHLRQRLLLSEEQVGMYDKIRGYRQSEHDHGGHASYRH